MPELIFFVKGKPATQGSKTFFGRGRVVDSCKRLPEWRADVRNEFQRRFPDHQMITDRSIRMSVIFFLSRPKSHYGTGRNADKLKSSAPKDHTQKPDATKLFRAVEDSLSGIAYKDDSQNDVTHTEKYWSNNRDVEGARILIRWRSRSNG